MCIRDSPGVVLWPDTFSNFLHAQAPSAAHSVLERLGFDVRLPGNPVCCGRPLYDYGWLEDARKRLEHTLQTLQPAMDEGLPVVGLEPSCLSVFQDELLNLFPHDDRARWLVDNSWLLPDFLAREQGLALPGMTGNVLLHGHCHQTAGAGLQGTREVLERMGLRVSTPDTGCCGMAGGFGFEADKYAVSQKIGESVLLPAVRQASPETWVVSDGFSCREQIQRGTGRRVLHTAELLDLALARA